MNSGYHRALIGVLTAGALSLPLLSTALAAPPKKAPKKPPAKKADAKKGQTQFKSEGCSGCHKTKDYPDGGAVGPDLSAVAKEHTVPEITAYIKKPKQGSVMPALKAEPQVTNISAYLATQK